MVELAIGVASFLLVFSALLVFVLVCWLAYFIVLVAFVIVFFPFWWIGDRLTYFTKTKPDNATDKYGK